MKIRHILTILFVLSILGALDVSEAKKKGKKGKKGKSNKPKMEAMSMPDVSSPKRPNNIEPRAYCFACQLMIDYSVKSLGKKKDEADILEMVDEKNICNYKNY